jgi:uncharacterized membrane protein (UPF0127 family)
MANKDFLFIKDIKLQAEIALTQKEQELGLMHRNTLPEAMVFVYSKPQINKFWMSNTFKPLDIIFSLNNKIINIEKGIPLSLFSIGNNEKSNLVIEVPFGFCKNKNIVVGDVVDLQLSKQTRMRALRMLA